MTNQAMRTAAIEPEHVHPDFTYEERVRALPVARIRAAPRTCYADVPCGFAETEGESRLKFIG